MVAVSAQPPDLHRLGLGRGSFAVVCPLAPLGGASYPVRVPRLADSLPAAFSRPLPVAAWRFAWVVTTNSPGDSHPQVTIHAGHTNEAARVFTGRSVVAWEWCDSATCTPPAPARDSGRAIHVGVPAHHGTHLEERAMGFEPTTSSLGSWHSTPELRPRIGQNARWGVNRQRPTARSHAPRRVCPADVVTPSGTATPLSRPRSPRG